MEVGTYKPTVPDAKPLVAMVYAGHPAGCCLHIVLDDQNVSDSSVDFCIEWAREKKHALCEVLALMLRRMTKTQRMKLACWPLRHQAWEKLSRPLSMSRVN